MGKSFWRCFSLPVDSLALGELEVESDGMLKALRLSALATFATLAAAAHAGAVSVQSVEFQLVDPPEGGRSWYEVAVELEVDRSDGESRRTSRFASDVTVRVALAFEVEGEGETAFVFFSSEVELVALEVGRRATRFYLPAEIVDRDRIRGEPFAYEITVEQGGEVADALVSRSIESEAALNSFRARLAEAETRGILRPQHLTPFWLLYPNSSPAARLK